MTRQLGDLEAVIMNLFWDRSGPMTVREVLEELNADRKLAYTTVMTVMDNLHRKDLLTRTQQGRAYRYQPAHSRADHAADLVATALESSGDRASTLLRFVERLDAGEVAQLRASLDRLNRSEAGPGPDRSP